MGDENLLVLSKLREQARGDLDHGDSPYPHGGLIGDETHASAISFLSDALRDSSDTVSDTDLGAACLNKWVTEASNEAVHRGDSALAAHLTGVTEQDLDGSALRLPLQLLERLDNYEATAFIAGAGNPNTGKTNLVALLSELRRADRDDLLVISNSRTWSGTDLHVASAHDLALELLRNRDRPKFVFIDEGSTHFDARTNSREVATQFSPFAKRFAKVGVDVFATVGHTGKDLHPELKRLVTTAFFKTDKKTVDFYDDWPADDDFPADRLFGGSVEDLEPAQNEPDPDDSAPWNWNLRADLFAEDLEWSGLLDRLEEVGPAD